MDQSLIVKDGNLANAVVTITDIKSGKKIDAQKSDSRSKGLRVSTRMCWPFRLGQLSKSSILTASFTTFIPIARLTARLTRRSRNLKRALEVKIDKPEAVEVKCDVHGWMHGWLVATANPYFAVTDGSGSFKLTDVPAGSYTVEVWHEKLGKSTQKVDRQGQRRRQGKLRSRRQVNFFSSTR